MPQELLRSQNFTSTGEIMEAMKEMFRDVIQTVMEVELDEELGRNGSFGPKIIGKYSRNVDGMEEKILSLYSCGMSQRDIAEQIKELYDVEISPELVTRTTEKVMPEVTANRLLEAVYPSSRLQRCIVHQIRSSTCFVSWKDIKYHRGPQSSVPADHQEQAQFYQR